MDGSIGIPKLMFKSTNILYLTSLSFLQGANSYGQLGLGHTEDILLPQALTWFFCDEGNIKNITGGGGHSAVLTGKIT